MSFPIVDKSWLINQAKQYKRTLIYANCIAFLATAISVPIPLLLPLMVDEVLLDQPANGIATLNQLIPETWQTPTGYILVMLFCIILMRILSQALNVYQTRQFTYVSKRITCQMRQWVLDKIGTVSIKQFEEKGSGGITSHLVTDIETIDKFIGTTLSRFVVGLLTLMGTGAILLWLNWQLGLFIILMNPMVVLLSRMMGSRIKHLKQKENKAFEQFQQKLVETLDGLYQLRASNREKQYLEVLKQDADSIRENADQYAWQSDAASRFSFLIFLIGFEIFRAAAMIMVIFSDLSIGQIFAVFGYLWFMLSPVQELLGIQFSWYGAKAAIKRINGLLSLEEEERLESKVNPFHDKGDISVEIKNVHFSYNDDRSVLNGLTLSIPAGKSVALVGTSGGGKSTLIQLLLGLYKKMDGDILINGETVERVSYELLRTHMSVVLQNPMIFNDTLRGNLTLGRDYSDEELWNALEVAQLSHLRETLSEGLDSHIGRQGVRLSGGQRQRVAIARMVLDDPKFVILDEATSALDTTTEANLHRALQSFLKNRTTLIVAHRLSAVKHADIIYVLDDGKVSQSGSHDELLAQEGHYRTLYS
ncbi:ABC transporter ATP-binding protein/permease [Vibrio sp.]|nr:ABC transporter ATP-binding protein/permease [Vibrio sp.]